jgi:serine/threonine protein phosphatase PrpC
MASRFSRRDAAGPKEAKVPIEEAVAELITPKTRPHSLIDLMEDLQTEACPVTVEVAHYTSQNWGARHENEDRYAAHRETFGPASSSRHALNFHTIGVMDGHESETASDLVSRELPEVLARRLKAGEHFMEAFTATMAELEAALKKMTSTAGTCVNVCTVAGRFVWCANLGDCRASLVPLQVPTGMPQERATPKASSIVWLSRDHKASLPDEMRRIKAAGGTVIDGRVDGLEPSRTLGDFDVKTSVNKGVISIEPEVRRHELGDGVSPAQAILIIASDGVWDVMAGQDVCDLIHARKELLQLQYALTSRPPDADSPHSDTRPLKDLAEDLVQFSVARGSRDDCTAVVALISVQVRERRGSKD